MPIVKPLVCLAVMALLMVRLPAAVLDYSPPLQEVTVSTVGNPATTVIYSVFDPAVGNVVAGNDTTGTVQGLVQTNGVVAWSDGASYYARVYEPGRAAWVKTNLFVGTGSTDLATAHGVVAWTVRNGAFQMAWDRARQRWSASATTFAGSASNLRIAQGHVAWTVGSTVFYRAHDPVSGQWTGNQVPLPNSVFDLTARHGVLTWSVNVGFNLSDIYMLTFDPSRGAWANSSVRTGSTFDLKTDNGVVAWSDNFNGRIHFFAYDPARGGWRGGNVLSGQTQNLLVQAGTVTWSANNVNFTRGYDVGAGQWIDGLSVPHAAFGATPSAGNAPLRTFFYDLSLGAGSWSWSFGDGGTATRRSLTHVYENFDRNAVTLTVLGPGGGPVSTNASILSDVTPPEGSLLIDGGAETTTNRMVALALDASDNSGLVEAMRFSNNGVSWSDWMPFADTASWLVTEGSGRKTVSAQFRDRAGNESSPASDTIELDLTPPPTVRFEPGNYSVAESATSLVVRVELSHPLGSPVSVDVATINGTALAGEDYVATTTTLLFAPSQVAQTFSVMVLEDTVTELDEQFILEISNPTNAVLGAAATVTIRDDDPPEVFFAQEQFEVREGSGPALIGVSLGAAYGRSVSVRYLATNGTATAGTDYEAVSGQLLFSPGQTFLTFPVPILDDAVDEPVETVHLTLRMVVEGLLVAPSNTVLRIEDDDPPRAEFGKAFHAVDESDGSFTVEVRLSSPFHETVLVDYATSNETARAGSDYIAALGSLVYFPGQTSKVFSVTLVDDDVPENTETLRLALFEAVNATLDPQAPSLVRIRDDDAPRFLTQAINGSGQFQATIAGEPGEVYLIQASTNFNAWFPLELLTNTTGAVLWVDPATGTFRYRHYRVRLFNP